MYTIADSPPPDVAADVKSDTSFNDLAEESALIASSRLSSSAAPDRLSYDDCLTLAGTGAFQYWILGLTGWTNASDAVEILAVSFLLPSAETDLQLTSEDKGYLGSIIFVGMLVGGWLWGTLADRYGRKSTLMVALLLNSIAGFLSAFSPTLSWMMAWRFLAGLGVGGSVPVIFTFFSEMVPSKERGHFMVFLAMFWMVGSVLTAGLAWSILPLDTVGLAGREVPSWRFFTAVCALPALLCVAMLCLTPESARFLLSAGRRDEAIEVLRLICRVNRRGCRAGGGLGPCAAGSHDMAEGEAAMEGLVDIDVEPSPALPHPPSSPSNDALGLAEYGSYHRNPEGTAISREPEPAQPGIRRRSSLWETGKALLEQNVTLWKRHRRISLLSSFVWFGLSFGYYGLTMWIPDYFAHLDSVNTYLSTFLSAVSNLPGNLISIWSVNAIGRGRTLAIAMLLSSISVLGVFAVKSGAGVVAVLCVFGGVSVPGWNSLNIVTTELYPTHIRSTAYGVFAAIGRVGAVLGSVAFGQLSGSHPSLPLLIVSVCLLAGGFAALALPDTRKAVFTK